MSKKRERYFQWLEGELAGTIEVLDYITQEDGEYFYNFKSGESCNLRFISKFTKDYSDLKDKFMVEITSPADPWISETIGTKKVRVMDSTQGETSVEAPALEDITSATGTGSNLNIEKSKIGTIKYKPPKYSGPGFELPNFDDYIMDDTPADIPTVTVTDSSKYILENQKPAENTDKEIVAEPSHVKHVPDETPKISVVPETDPVRILAKTCKKHPTEITLSININLPSKSIYNIAESEFDNGGKNFVDCLVESIDIREIVESISNALHTAYTTPDEAAYTKTDVQDIPDK